LLCGRLSRSHCASCPSVRLSVCPSVRASRLLTRKKLKSTESQDWCKRLPAGVGLTGVPNCSLAQAVKDLADGCTLSSLGRRSFISFRYCVMLVLCVRLFDDRADWTARDLHYRETRLQKMRQLRNKMEAERMLRDEGASLMEKVQVRTNVRTQSFALAYVLLINLRNESRVSVDNDSSEFGRFV